MGAGGQDEWVLNLAHALKGRNRSHVRQVTAAARAAGVPESLIRALTDLSRPATIPQPVATPLRRFARGLEIPLFEEVDGRIAPLTHAAEKKLGVGFPGSAADAIEVLTGYPSDDAALGECLSRARRDGEASLTLQRGGDRWRLHATLAVSGLQVAVIPRSSGSASELEVLATVNHEMANGLTAMASLAARALHPSASGEQAKKALQRIEQAASDTLRSVQSTRRALRRRGTQSEAPTAADLGPLLHDLVDSFAAVASRRNVAVHSDIGSALIAAAPAEDLRSIVWNLMKNAIEAVDDGGTVQVRAEAVVHQVRIIVADDGPGMDAATRTHAFDPYYTTKKEGSGLGLPLVRHLTLRLGGELELETEAGQGTQITVLLPRVRTVEVPGSVRAPAPSGMRPSPSPRSAVLVGKRAETLETMLRANRVHLETLAGVLAEELPVAWAFMDPDAASFAKAIRASAGQIVWLGELPDEGEDEDAVLDGSLDADTLARWLLTHPVQSKDSGAASGE